MQRSLLTIALLTSIPLLTASNAFAQETQDQPPPPVAPQPAAPVLPPHAPSAVAPPNAPPHQGEHPHAHLVSATIESGDKNAVIERRLTTEETSGRVLVVVPFHTENETWQQVCVAPCRVDLDPHSTYRVAQANGVPSTHEFTLPPGAPSPHVKVEPGNLVAHHIGMRLIAVGAAATIVGGVLIPAAAKFDDEKEVRTAGVITAGAGALLLAVGIPLAIATATRVTVDDRKVARKKPTTGPQLGLGGIVF